MYMDVRMSLKPGIVRNDLTRYCAIDSLALSSEPYNLNLVSLEKPEFFQLNRLECMLSSFLTSHTFPTSMLVTKEKIDYRRSGS